MKNQVHPSLWHGHSLGPSGAQTPSLILSFPSRAGEVCVSPRRRRAIPPPLLISLLTTASHVTVIFPILHGRKPKHREVKQLDQGHKARKQQRQNLHLVPGLSKAHRRNQDTTLLLIWLLLGALPKHFRGRLLICSPPRECLCDLAKGRQLN